MWILCEIVLTEAQWPHAVTLTFWQGVGIERSIPKSVPQVTKSYYVSCSCMGRSTCRAAFELFARQGSLVFSTSTMLVSVGND